MSKLKITEYASAAAQYTVGAQAPQEARIRTQVVDFSGGVTQCADGFDAETRLVRITSDADCCYTFGPNPTATTNDSTLWAKAIEYKGVRPGMKISVIANA